MDTATLCSLALEPLGGLLWSLYEPPNVALKQIECQIFLWQRWSYSGSAEIAIWGLEPW